MNYESVIGLEVHSELSTKSKIFCSCSTKFGGEVNTQCCPICTGMPGVLPVLNKEVINYCVKMGMALNCNINQQSKQDRKNYFYPDLPKAYQISQFDIPICQDGYLEFYSNGSKKKVRINRIHIEEDAGKLIHDDEFGGTLVDFNRGGVPLIEIVTEPDLRSSEEAKNFLENIKLILQYLDISDCKMQEGSIRCDINVSIRKKGDTEFGTRVEMKNVNSFSAAVRAIDYEISRQIELLNKGIPVEQETRRWDDVKGKNFLLRTKEDANEYRYFPEPDLTPFVIDDKWLDSIKAQIPELPNQKTLRYINDCDLPVYDAELLVSNHLRAKFFDDCIKDTTVTPKAVANWILGDVSKILNEKNIDIDESPLTPEKLNSLIKIIDKGTISISAGKKVLDEMFNSGKDPDLIVKELGLAQISDEDSIKELAAKVLSENQKSVDDYKKGKTNAMGYLIGQAMRASRGKANPKILNKVIQELLEKQ